jgi:hypothetical protein
VKRGLRFFDSGRFDSGSVNVGELIENARLHPVRVAGVVLCAVVALFDGFDLQIIGLAAPSIAATMHFLAGALGCVFRGYRRARFGKSRPRPPPAVGSS